VINLEEKPVSKDSPDNWLPWLIAAFAMALITGLILLRIRSCCKRGCGVKAPGQRKNFFKHIKDAFTDGVRRDRVEKLVARLDKKLSKPATVEEVVRSGIMNPVLEKIGQHPYAPAMCVEKALLQGNNSIIKKDSKGEPRVVVQQEQDMGRNNSNRNNSNNNCNNQQQVQTAAMVHGVPFPPGMDNGNYQQRLPLVPQPAGEPIYAAPARVARPARVAPPAPPTYGQHYLNPIYESIQGGETDELLGASFRGQRSYQSYRGYGRRVPTVAQGGQQNYPLGASSRYAMSMQDIHADLIQADEDIGMLI
jgi:hypothetical protein